MIASPPALSPQAAERALALAHATFDIEAAAVLGLKSRLGDSFAQAVALALAIPGRVVVMGMGKSGHVGRKIAATLASTGTPAMFVHPAEASHGDLGMITGDDVVLASGARLACDVPLLVLSQSTPAWLHDTGLADSADGVLSLGQHILTDAHQRSTSVIQQGGQQNSTNNGPRLLGIARRQHQ